jgi:hypothetical protein
MSEFVGWIRMPEALVEGELRYYTIGDELLAWLVANEVKRTWHRTYKWCFGFKTEESFALFKLRWNVGEVDWVYGSSFEIW